MHKTPRRWTKVEVERQVRPAGYVGRDRVRSATMVHLIREGRLEIVCGGRSVSCGRGRLVWIPRGMRTTESSHTHTSLLTVRLRVGAWAAEAEADRQAVALLRRIDVRVHAAGPVLPLTPQTADALSTHLEGLARLWGQPALPYHHCALKAGAMQMLTMLTQDPRLEAWTPRLDDGSPRAVAAERVAEALHLLDHREFVRQGDLRVEDLADSCGYGVSRFHALFLQATGVTPQRYLTERRVTLACELLTRPHQTILEVAMACGFGTQSRFYAAFKEVTGQTPGQYRRSQSAAAKQQ
ncbi:MAG: helix-turn-helix domain-containing protein [Planctomycetota bacterium]